MNIIFGTGKMRFYFLFQNKAWHIYSFRWGYLLDLLATCGRHLLISGVHEKKTTTLVDLYGGIVIT